MIERFRLWLLRNGFMITALTVIILAIVAIVLGALQAYQAAKMIGSPVESAMIGATITAVGMIVLAMIFLYIIALLQGIYSNLVQISSQNKNNEEGR